MNGFVIQKEQQISDLTVIYDAISQTKNNEIANEKRSEIEEMIADQSPTFVNVVANFSASVHCKIPNCHNPGQMGSDAELTAHNFRYHSKIWTFGCGYCDNGEKCNFLARRDYEVHAHLKKFHKVSKKNIQKLTIDLFAGGHKKWSNEEEKQRQRLSDPILRNSFKQCQKQQRIRQKKWLKEKIKQSLLDGQVRKSQSLNLNENQN